jgi:hypothetical protein
MENQIRTWEIIFMENNIQKTVLTEGYSSILEENEWRNKNPHLKFIQINLYK